MFFFVIFLFSSRRKENKTKKKNPKRRKIMQRREGAYLQASTLPSHFWLSLLASCFWFFVSSTFSLAFSFSK
jgi:hypothetical protein